MGKLRNILALISVVIAVSITALAFPLNACAQGQGSPIANKHASAQLDRQPDHIRGGSDIAIKIKLDEPLPEGARFDVRLTPVAVSQEVSISSGEPLNRERTEFIVRTKLPEQAYPGPWHIGMVWLFLPGASWTSSTIRVNDVNFTVEGRQLQLPTKGTATLVSEAR